MRIIAILLMIIFIPPCFAGEPDTVISLPSGTIESGQPSELSVYFFNTGKDPVHIQLPDTLTCLISSNAKSIEITAYGLPPFSQGPVEINEGMFIKRQYSFNVPEELEGAAGMKIKELAVSEAMFTITAASLNHGVTVQAKESDSQKPKDLMNELFSLYQPYNVSFSAYEPVYFLVGTNPEKSKFQISFKYQIFKDENSLAVNHPWVKGFNLGYTQTSFWDLKSASAPFKDTSYKPELFYLSSNINLRPDWMNGLLFQAGARHESNGQGGESSRSTNTLYIRPIFILYREDSRFGLLLSPGFRAYVNNSLLDNRNFPDYRGNFDLDIKLGKADSLVIGSNLVLARKGPSVQVDLTYPLNRYIFKDLNLFLQVQYVDALAENLLYYQKRTQAFRVGFALIR